MHHSAILPKAAMFGKNYFHTCFPALILFLQVSYARTDLRCSPSSCGNIQNISYPFRLKDDPQRCGDRSYELVCEHNTTLLYLDSHKYYVKAINYQNYTIHLVDASIVSNDVCSFPNHSLSVTDNWQYSTRTYNTDNKPDMVTSITFFSCPNLLNDPRLVQIDVCLNRSGIHSYVRVGQLYARDLEEMCKTDVVAMTSMPFKNPDKVSLAGIHASLLYGFQLSWFSVRCANCRGQAVCWLDGNTCRVLTCAYLKGGTLDCAMEISSTPTMLVLGTILSFLVIVIGFGIAVRITIGLPCLLAILIYRYRTRHLSKFHDIEGFLQNQTNLMPIRYSYTNIKRITGGFKQKLGQGGFGSVYKGKLRNGHDIAVKMLNNIKSNGQDFINEVGTLGRIHHANVVKLVGYCAEKSTCALVYDFMPNGSLDRYMSTSREERLELFDWKKKHEIAVGVAKGIDYLHRGCDIKILHFDIKPHNILLDSEFNPKISDFGLAKFYSNKNSTVALTAARGTIGYVAPELTNRSIGGVSNKADVYSFGMVLIDMLGLKGDVPADSDDNSSRYFPDWIYDRLNKGKDVITGDGNDDEEMDDHARNVKRNMIGVALWCIQMNPVDRPSMREVLEMLEGENGVVEIPPQGCLTSTFVVNEAQTWATSSSDSTALLYSPGL